MECRCVGSVVGWGRGAVRGAVVSRVDGMGMSVVKEVVGGGS